MKNEQVKFRKCKENFSKAYHRSTSFYTCGSSKCGYGMCTDEVEPSTNIQKSLFAVDELTGIVHAYALMRPEKMEGMALKSLKKKYKDKKFAAGCNRDVINDGIAKLGMEQSDVMQACIDGMKEHAEELGLA